MHWGGRVPIVKLEIRKIEIKFTFELKLQNLRYSLDTELVISENYNLNLLSFNQRTIQYHPRMKLTPYSCSASE